MVRHDDGVGAARRGLTRIFRVEDPLEHQLAGPAFTHPGHVAPRDGRVELPTHPRGQFADAAFREEYRQVSERPPPA
jgi:hypothetical protein